MILKWQDLTGFCRALMSLVVGYSTLIVRVLKGIVSVCSSGIRQPAVIGKGIISSHSAAGDVVASMLPEEAAKHLWW